MSATEDGITDLMADYLRDNGVNAATQVSISTPGTRSQPDFQIKVNGMTFVGEAKWENKKWEGFGEARDYGQLTGVEGTFLICYPEKLKQDGGQARLTDTAESVLSGHKFSCAFLRRDSPTDIVSLSLDEIPRWLDSHIKNERKPEPDPDEVVSVLRQTAYRLNEELETAPKENLFRNVLGASPEGKEEREAAKKTAGFLLVNQITFYRVLSSAQEFPEIDPDKLGSPKDLSEYFDLVLEVDYTPVFSFRIAEDLPQTSITILIDAIKSIYALRPESITHDVLGKVFHELIPIEARKRVAAYYTMNKPGQILADLSIDSSDAKVLDPACGSGSLLAAAYNRKRSLVDSEFTEKMHQQFVEDDITGIDVMPFAAHLSCIHLALQAPIYETDEVNIGIEDSTKLAPGSTISPLSFVLPQKDEQRGLSEFAEGQKPDVSEDAIEAGSVAMDAAIGQEMELKTMDTVIMNPPFTRQESVAGFADGYKDRLRDRFSRRDNKGHIHGKMSYCSYFLYLADKFLNEGGRIAAVIPATVLNKSTDSGVREMLLNDYDIEYIFAREDNPNFSEDTDLREVMIIARKGNTEDASTTYVSLDGLDVDSSLIRNVSEQLKDEKAGEVETIEDGSSTATVWRVPREQMDTHNLFSPFAVQNHSLFQLWGDILEQEDNLTQIQHLDAGLTRGGSSHPWTGGCIGAPDTNLRKSDVWQVKSANEDKLEVKHRHVGETVTVPRDAVEPYFLRKPYRQKLDITDLEEHTVVREFDELDRFLSLSEEDGIPDGWESHIVDNAAHTSIPETVDLTAPGTSHIVYFTSKPRVSHRMWMHSDLNEAESKVLSLWFDSSFGLLQMLLTRVPGRGGWTKYRKYTQNRFYTIHPNRLSDEDKELLMDCFEDVHDVEAPSLVKQMASNVNPDNLSDEQTAALERHFPEAEDELGDGFEPKKTLDETILSVLGFEETRMEEILETIYVDLLIELVELKEMMD
ncbi:type IIG restriction modification enzyme [Halorubrum tailed virus 10]|uniref:site-specific DNA-methyltransferase (adenine-specific) n=1 Tax=Halorubrum tailed virus 10 TaxID=2877991 RepID=A0AAE8XSF5_9CAUD|nr:type IIG restriction modification enzyme [Halorubrum tailed virus 10]UBF19622.1 type IIG restriction modification enzyme [Halorubrum tailed virus 10]